jgi:hypothetical protein
MKDIIALIILTVICVDTLSSQIGSTIGSDRRVDWTKARVKEYPVTFVKYIDVTQDEQYPLVPGGGDDSPNFNSMLESRNKNLMTVYYFPQGVYHFHQQILLDKNVIIRGAGSDKTEFVFSQSEYNIVVNDITGAKVTVNGIGESAVETYIIGGKNKGSTILTFDKEPNIKVGDLIDLMCHDDWPNWSGSGSAGENHYKIGQVSMVVEKQGNTVTIADELRLDFNYDYARSSAPGFVLWADKIVDYAYNVGIENTKVEVLRT